MVALLAQTCIDVDERNDSEETPLHCATEPGSARLLLAAGADVNAVSAVGLTPLHAAILQENTGLTRILVEAGANLDIKSDEGVSPLISASELGCTESVRLLAEEGADLEAAKQDG